MGAYTRTSDSSKIIVLTTGSAIQMNAGTGIYFYGNTNTDLNNDFNFQASIWNNDTNRLRC